MCLDVRIDDKIWYMQHEKFILEFMTNLIKMFNQY